MPNAGAPARPARGNVVPWWEELDSEAFREFRAATEASERDSAKESAVPAITEREQLELATTAPYTYDDNGRRTVHITGRGAERNLPVTRPTLRRHEREGFRPDRAAMWAVLLGLLLILVAATSAHAAVLAHQLAR
jgi:hypothetical protein